MDIYLNTHNSKDEPEKNAHSDNVSDSGNTVNECVDNDSHAFPSRDGSQRSQSSQRSHRSQWSDAWSIGADANPTDADDNEIKDSPERREVLPETETDPLHSHLHGKENGEDKLQAVENFLNRKFRFFFVILH